MNINYREDFLLRIGLTDCEGERVEVWPAHDFAGIISTSGGTHFRFGRRGGELYNCQADPDDAGVLLVALDSHGLMPGRLVVNMEMLVPDAMMPDGTRRVVLSSGDGCSKGGRRIEMEDVTLVYGASDCADKVTIEATAPFIVRTAYDMARQMGYDGTQADYEAALSALPSVAQTSAAVAQMAVDVAEGRRSVIEQINARGIAALPADAAMADVAAAIRSARLAVDGDPGLVMPSACGLQTYDLLNEVRNHQLADYPYCSAIRLSYRDVLLEGADAYLCSDGFFCETPESGEATEHTFDDWGEHYIIYYYRSPNYAFQPDDNSAAGMRDSTHTHSEWLVYSGNEVTLNGWSRNLIGAFKACHGGVLVMGTSLSTNVTEVVIKASMISGAASFSNETLREGATLLNDATLLRSAVIGGDVAETALLHNCSGVYHVSMPELKEANNRVVSCCSNLLSLCLPKLEKANARLIYSCIKLSSVSLPQLKEATRISVVESCESLSSLSLPQLRVASGSVRIDYNCSGLKMIDLPALEIIEDSAELVYLPSNTYRAITVNCPKLKRITSAGSLSRGIFLWNINNHNIILNVPELEYVRTYLIGSNGNNSPITVNLGAQQEAERLYIAFWSSSFGAFNVVTVQPGFRSSLNISRFGCTDESLSALIANLADNNGHATLTLTLGSGNIGRLSDEDIAVAQAKNYTVA